MQSPLLPKMRQIVALLKINPIGLPEAGNLQDSQAVQHAAPPTVARLVQMQLNVARPKWWFQVELRQRVANVLHQRGHSGALGDQAAAIAAQGLVNCREERLR